MNGLVGSGRVRTRRRASRAGRETPYPIIEHVSGCAGSERRGRGYLARAWAGTDANPVGTAFVGRAHAGDCEVVRWGWIGTRYEIMSRTAELALNAVTHVRIRFLEPGG